MTQKLEVTQKIEDKTSAKFVSLATDADLIYSKPEPDRTGKDFLLNWPDDASAKISADKNPTRRACCIQLKGTQNSAHVDLKLKSAEWLVNTSQPAFICAMTVDEKYNVTGVYMFHITGQHLKRILKMLRQAGAKKENLAKKKIRFSLSKGHKLDANPKDLREWLENEIGKDIPTYVQEKEIEKKTIGYDSDSYTSELQVSAKSREQLRKAFIGKGVIDIHRIRTIETRFGIPLDTKTQISEAPRALSVDMINPIPCALKISTEGEILRLSGVVDGVIQSEEIGSAMNFQADCLELEIHQEPEQQKSVSASSINLKFGEFNSTEYLPSRAIEIISAFVALYTEPTTLQFEHPTGSSSILRRQNAPPTPDNDLLETLGHLLNFYQDAQKIWSEAASSERPIVYSPKTAGAVSSLINIINNKGSGNLELCAFRLSDVNDEVYEIYNTIEEIIVISAIQVGDALFAFTIRFKVKAKECNDTLSFIAKSNNFIDLKHLNTDDILAAYNSYSENMKKRMQIPMVIIHEMEMAELTS